MAYIKFRDLFKHKNANNYYVCIGDSVLMCIQSDNKYSKGRKTFYSEVSHINVTINDISDETKEYYKKFIYPVGTYVKGNRKTNKYVNPDNKFKIIDYRYTGDIVIYKAGMMRTVKTSSVTPLTNKEIDEMTVRPPFKVGDIIRKKDENVIRFVIDAQDGNDVDESYFVYTSAKPIFKKSYKFYSPSIMSFDGYEIIEGYDSNTLNFLLSITSNFTSREIMMESLNKIPDSPMKKELLKFLDIIN